MKELILVLAFLLSIIGIGFFFSWIGKRNAKRVKVYEHLYDYINQGIDIWDVNEDNYEHIELYRRLLLSLSHKNPEKTEVLTQKFRKKFYKQWLNAILKDQE